MYFVRNGEFLDDVLYSLFGDVDIDEYGLKMLALLINVVLIYLLILLPF